MTVTGAGLLPSSSIVHSSKAESQFSSVQSLSYVHGIKLNIQKTKIMASSPITTWQIDRETMESVRDFILGGPQITTDGDCSCEIKRHLLLGRKAMANLNNILKSRDIILLTKVLIV